MSDVQYNLLYSVYSLPNLVLPLMGGVFVDKIGVNTCNNFLYKNSLPGTLTRLKKHSIFFLFFFSSLDFFGKNQHMTLCITGISVTD